MAEDLITGYQYGPEKGEFRGEYRFPNNMDKDEIHVPPFTTLVAPPADVPFGKYPCWDGKKWILKLDENLSGIKPQEPPIENLGGMRRDFVEEQIARGLWPESRLAEYEVAAAELEAARQAEIARFEAERLARRQSLEVAATADSTTSGAAAG